MALKLEKNYFVLTPQAVARLRLKTSEKGFYALCKFLERQFNDFNQESLWVELKSEETNMSRRLFIKREDCCAIRQIDPYLIRSGQVLLAGPGNSVRSL